MFFFILAQPEGKGKAFPNICLYSFVPFSGNFLSLQSRFLWHALGTLPAPLEACAGNLALI
jgi:hypothetical protein